MYNPLFFVHIILRIIRWLNSTAVANREQQARNTLAEEIANQLERNIASGLPTWHRVPKFALYLRPFLLENQLRQIRYWTLFPPFPIMTYFDRILQDYFTPRGITLVSIGPLNEREGAGHLITSDMIWQKHFRLLAASATKIIVVPGNQPGIKSEIRWLRTTGLVAKTVFFKPTNYPKSDWEEMQTAFRTDEHVLLPAYSKKQITFRLRASGESYETLMWNSVYGAEKRQRGHAQMSSLLLEEP